MLLQFIGERIRQIRKAKGLTQEELAEKAGINASYMGTVERGDRNISIGDFRENNARIRCNTN